MVHAEETRLQGLLEGTKQYLVPLYQRTYSWTAVQHQPLWDDIVQLAADRAGATPQASHFIGSLVLAPTPTLGPAGVAQYLVVDGQQRLTTLSILLMAIRDHRAATEDSGHRLRIDQQYLMNTWAKDEAHRSKLVPTQTDQPSYLACLHSTHAAGGGDALGKAYTFFRTRLQSFDDPDDPYDIERIEQAVLDGLALVAVTAQVGDNVHRIFESLNNTGLKLTQADLLRNYLFMRMPTLGEKVHQMTWLPLQAQLNRDELEQLFWLDLVQTNPRIKQGDTYAAQQTRLERLHSELEIQGEVERFARLGGLLTIILRPATETDVAVRRGLERLQSWGTSTVNPLVLHLLTRRDQGSATSAQVSQALTLIESYLVRRLILGRSTMNINRILLSAVTEMNPDRPVDEALRTYLSTGRKHWATDDDVRQAVTSQPFYWQGKSTQRLLVLRWLEETYGGNEHVDPRTLTIEHVLPQTSTPEWTRMLASDLASDENVTEVYDGLLHTLGNLTITGYNASLGNRPFAEKQAKLRVTSIVMNQQIADQERWARPQILGRASDLAERAIRLWPGPPPGVPVESTVWDVMNQALAELPAGSWTTYGDIAVLIGTHPVPVGVRLSTHPAPNAHRVLQSNGAVSSGFRWLDPEQDDDPVDLLRQEGVTFDAAGHADSAQRLSAEELAELIGLSTESLSQVPDPQAGANRERRDTFLEQLSREHQPEIVNAVLRLLTAWTEAGGTLQFGKFEQATCFLMTRTEAHPDGSIWPVAIYPQGKVEVVFQYLSTREPFVDLAAREELRTRLNAVEGIDLPAAKIQMRPSFPLTLLANDRSYHEILGALSWFQTTATS